MNNPKFIASIFKKFNRFINNLLEKNLNKLNVNNSKNLLINNKIFLSIVAVIILFLSYLSFPNIHNKEEVASEIKKRLKKCKSVFYRYWEVFSGYYPIVCSNPLKCADDYVLKSYEMCQGLVVLARTLSCRRPV